MGVQCIPQALSPSASGVTDRFLGWVTLQMGSILTRGTFSDAQMEVLFGNNRRSIVAGICSWPHPGGLRWSGDWLGTELLVVCRRAGREGVVSGLLLGGLSDQCSVF